MKRVYIIVEGQTERAFVHEVIRPHLSVHGLHSIPRLLRTGEHKGGVISYQRARSAALDLLKGDRRAYCTTMFDFFQLPRDFPCLPVLGSHSAERKADILEKAFFADIAANLRPALRPDRFLPYIQMHEFEGLLFSDPDGFCAAIHQDDLAESVRAIRRRFGTPEDIDDGQETAPSKRILRLLPDYQKAQDGPIAASAIGLAVIRRECRHFNDWVSRLERLAEGA